MPSRIVVAGIVVFWLATTGFTFYRDIWPRFFASNPPPVVVELVDEARLNLHLPAKWDIFRNGQRIGVLDTQTKYHEADDTFQFTYAYTELTLKQGDITLVVSEAVSSDRMTRSGELKEQTMNARVKVKSPQGEIAGTIDIRGLVKDGTLNGRATLKSGLMDLEGDLDPVAVPRGSRPLNPMQPVNRLAHVRGGQEWVVNESNPLQDAVRDLLKKKVSEFGIRLPEEKKKESLVAKVDTSPQTLKWQEQDVSCWVIEYRRIEVVARTWVRVTDGKVLRQELSEKGETLTFERKD